MCTKVCGCSCLWVLGQELSPAQRVGLYRYLLQPVHFTVRQIEMAQGETLLRSLACRGQARRTVLECQAALVGALELGGCRGPILFRSPGAAMLSCRHRVARRGRQGSLQQVGSMRERVVSPTGPGAVVSKPTAQ